MKYTQKEIDIFKKCVSDYKKIKKDIIKKIEKGYSIKHLYDYIRHINECDITNVELESDNKYFDFNYSSMCISIYQDSHSTPYLGDSIEVWNDEELYYIDTFNNIQELEEIIKKEV